MELKDLKNIAIHCETEEQAELCCELADKFGWKRNIGSSYAASSNCWWWYKGNTCYSFYNGTYSDIDTYKNSGYTIKPASWFLENFKTKDNMEEKETKKGTLAEMYACANDELKKVLESKFSKDELGIEVILPNTWEEFCEQNPVCKGECCIWEDSTIVSVPFDTYWQFSHDRNFLPSEKSAEAHLALMKLEQLRDCYRQGWLPNWEDGSNKYTIYKESNTITTERSVHVNHFLAFQTEDLCEKFYENFKDLIKTSRDLI